MLLFDLTKNPLYTPINNNLNLNLHPVLIFQMAKQKLLKFLYFKAFFYEKLGKYDFKI